MKPPPPSAEHNPDHQGYRAALRREKLAARLALDAAAHATLSAGLDRHLAALLLPLAPQTLAFCAPVRGEFDARPLASRLTVPSGLSCTRPMVKSCMISRA